MKTTKYNKSEILKNAWNSFKMQNIKTSQMFGMCLKNAWNIAKKDLIKPIEVKPEIKPIEVKKINFNQTYKDNYKYVCNVIKSTLRQYYLPLNDFDMIANNVFIRLEKVLNTIDVNKDIKPFLYRMSVNITIDYYRSEKNNNSNTKISDYTDEKGNEYFTILSSEKANTIENQELSNKINNEISKLGNKANEILTMYYIDGLKYREIAEVLNMPINSIGVFISRAKSVLHKNLKSDYNMIKNDYLYE